MRVSPGACRFSCRIDARRIDQRNVSIRILHSECQQILKLAESVQQISMQELFTPITKNPVYVSAQKVGCHPSCVIPGAILKTAEAALGMAVAKDVRFTYIACEAQER